MGKLFRLCLLCCALAILTTADAYGRRRRQNRRRMRNYASDDGQTQSESDKQCGENEVYQKCGTDCGQRCIDVREPVICLTQCYSGCFCYRGDWFKPGYYRQRKINGGACVPKEECARGPND